METAIMVKMPIITVRKSMRNETKAVPIVDSDIEAPVLMCRVRGILGV